MHRATREIRSFHERNAISSGKTVSQIDGMRRRFDYTRMSAVQSWLAHAHWPCIRIIFGGW